MVRSYLALTKPGIIRGNLVAAAAGFLLASHAGFDWRRFVCMTLGLGLVIAAACVFNNYMDRDIDAKMARTKRRPLVKGDISPQAAVQYGGFLLSGGIFVLYTCTNLLALATALTGLFFYVVVYGIAKRRTVQGTVIGSISGAIPPVVGYVAARGHFDLGALLVFLVLTLWQMPHFYAIAIFRREEYRAAGIPVLPLVSGIRATKLQIIAYIAAFIPAAVALTVFGYTGVPYAIAMTGLGLVWLALGIRGLNAADDNRYGRQMFKFSLLVLLSWFLLITLDAIT